MSGTVELDITVRWGDMDAFGHVNNTVYLRFFEHVRIAFFEEVGIQHRDIADGCAPILARTSCDFRRPLTYPDTVGVEISIEKIGNRSVTNRYRVRSHALGEVAAEGDSVIVWFDYGAGKSAPLPDDVRARLLAFQAAHKAQP